MVNLRKLLDRATPKEYLDENTQLLKHEQVKEKPFKEYSTVIFRLSNQWLALSSLVVNEIVESRPIHILPYRSGTFILGVVNVRGQLRICVSMHYFLDIPKEDEHAIKKDSSQEKLLVVQSDDDLWVFPVDEVMGIFNVRTDQVSNPPVTLLKSTFNYFKGLIEIENKKVGYLDEDLVLSSMRRKISER